MHDGRVASLALSAVIACVACTPFGEDAEPAAPASDAGSAGTGGDAGPAGDAGPIESGPIAWHGTSSAVAPNPPVATTLVLPPVPDARVGDVLVAAIALGDNSALSPEPPVFTAPTGWTELKRASRGDAMLAILYLRILLEPARPEEWRINRPVTGIGCISAYRGVHQPDPLVGAEIVIRDPGIASLDFAAPSIQTFAPGAMLVTAYFGKAAGGGGLIPHWKPPDGMSERTNVDNAGTRSGLCTDVLVAAAGPTGERVAVASIPLDYAVTAAIALRSSRAP